jgi:hypothetical protein
MEWQNHVAGEIPNGGFSPLFKPQMDVATKALGGITPKQKLAFVA